MSTGNCNTIRNAYKSILNFHIMENDTLSDQGDSNTRFIETPRHVKLLGNGFNTDNSSSVLYTFVCCGISITQALCQIYMEWT
jgi:hypothetical protein